MEKLRKTAIVIFLLQLVSSIFFLQSLYSLGMLPSKYLIIAAVSLLLLACLFIFTEMKSQKNRKVFKIISLLFSMVLFAATFFINKTSGTMRVITGDSAYNIQVNDMVVAVLADDPAENLADAADYIFGVQYALKGEEVENTVAFINEELKREIQVKEYQNMQEQIQALYENEVGAVIFNEAYIGILEEEFEDIHTRLRIIDTKTVEKQVEIPAKQEAQAEDNCFIVYISGIDVYGSIRKTSRSDVNILAMVNPDSHQVLLINTPRDYYIEFPGVTGGAKDKLTHAGIYGVDVSMAALGALYDIDPEYYVRVNFTSLVEMVDALGGVDVYSEYAFTTQQDGLVVSKGLNHFNGEQALEFCRERKNLPGGDFQRGKNQQAVITAMIQKVISPAILLGAGDIMESLAGNVDTNMSQSQIADLIKAQLNEPVSWDVTSMAAEGTGGSKQCYSMPGRALYVTYPDYESVDEIKEAIAKVRAGETLEE